MNFKSKLDKLVKSLAISVVFVGLKLIHQTVLNLVDFLINLLNLLFQGVLRLVDGGHQRRSLFLRVPGLSYLRFGRLTRSVNRVFTGIDFLVY